MKSCAFCLFHGHISVIVFELGLIGDFEITKHQNTFIALTEDDGVIVETCFKHSTVCFRLALNYY